MDPRCIRAQSQRVRPTNIVESTQWWTFLTGHQLPMHKISRVNENFWRRWNHNQGCDRLVTSFVWWTGSDRCHIFGLISCQKFQKIFNRSEILLYIFLLGRKHVFLNLPITSVVVWNRFIRHWPTFYRTFALIEHLAWKETKKMKRLPEARKTVRTVSKMMTHGLNSDPWSFTLTENCHTRPSLNG